MAEERVSLFMNVPRSTADRFREYVRKEKQRAEERDESIPTQGECLRKLLDAAGK